MVDKVSSLLISFYVCCKINVDTATLNPCSKYSTTGISIVFEDVEFCQRNFAEQQILL